MFLTKFILFVTIILNFILLIIVVARSRNSLLHKILAIFVFGTTGWIYFIFINLFFRNLIIERFVFAFAALSVISQVYFALLFPDNKLIKKIWSYILLTIGIFFIIVSFIPNTLFTKIEISPYGYTTLDYGILSKYYSLFILICIIIPIIVFYKKYKKISRENITKAQLKYLITGSSLFFIINVLTNSILPTFYKIYFFNAIGPVFSIVYATFLFYIMRKYKFLNIKVIFQRSLIYSFVIAVIIGFYLMLVSILGYIFANEFKIAVIFSAGVTVLAGIYGVPYIEKYFNRFTDKLFFKDKYDYSEAVFYLSQILNRNINLEALMEEVSVKLKEVFKIKVIYFFFPGQNLIFDGVKFDQNKIIVSESVSNYIFTRIVIFSEIPFIIKNLEDVNGSESEVMALKELDVIGDKFDIEVSMPLLIENKLVGVIILSKKQSGELYTDIDMKLLQTFSYQAAVAIEKAQLYNQVKSYSTELEKKVEHRTEKIKGLQEEQKKMMLEIAHGLQTPLTIIKGELDILAAEEKDSKKTKSLEKSIDRISKFIYDMLKLARRESCDDKLIKEKLNLSDLLEELTDSFEIITEDRKIKITRQIDAEVYVKGNKQEIEELINNLVSNSVKYMGDSIKREISISLKKEPKNARIIIEDSGIGIKEADLPNLFKRFYRGENEFKNINGTGLGLVICKNIVERHKGTIKVESTPGLGTKFIITLAK
jgi:signal transduction histidine kinase